MVIPEKATKPTMYFIGVTTKQSSVMTLFPHWMEILKQDAVIKGIDIEMRAAPRDYSDAVSFIKYDELSLGALVTTHKIDLYYAAKDLFEYFDPYALKFGELSSISKKDGRLEGYAKDPISSGRALEAFLTQDYWDRGGEVFIMGAGGSAIALGAYLLSGKKLPQKLIVSNRSEERLINIERIFRSYHRDIALEFVLAKNEDENDKILKRVKPNSLIVNATGLGKDRPGSPLTDACVFPENSKCWEFNYRGDLKFLHQALAQKEKRNLYVEDGFIYFLHGWMQVVAEVFHIDITAELFSEIEKVSSVLCGRKG